MSYECKIDKILLENFLFLIFHESLKKKGVAVFKTSSNDCDCLIFEIISDFIDRRNKCLILQQHEFIQISIW